VSPDWASAARPVKGALYGAVHSRDGGVSRLFLRISHSGRVLNPRRSVIDRGCAPRMHLGSRLHPVRISRGGRFRFVRRRHSFVFRLRGRFVTKNRATARFRCARSTHRFVARRVGLPFRECQTHEAETLLRSSTGRVFRVPKLRPYGWANVAYACLFSANRLVKLGLDVDGGGTFGELHDRMLFRLAGPYVAYDTQQYDCNCGSTVTVRDLRTGGFTRSLARRYLSNLRLKGNGSVAWIENPGYEGSPSKVWAADTHVLRQLDSGNISDNSLTLSGSTLTWRKDGVVRSATLY
jgi:hypothetical protein